MKCKNIIILRKNNLPITFLNTDLRLQISFRFQKKTQKNKNMHVFCAFIQFAWDRCEGALNLTF